VSPPFLASVVPLEDEVVIREDDREAVDPTNNTDSLDNPETIRLMTSTTLKSPDSARIGKIDLRLQRLKLKPDTAVAIVAVFIVLISDSQSLTLIPLAPALELQYHLTPLAAGAALGIGSIVGASAVPLLTRLGANVGMRRLVLISLILGLIGNLLCGLTTGAPLLIVGRALLGLGAAFPLTYAILRERATSVAGTNRSVGLITSALGLAIAVSFLLGGIVIQLKGSVQTVFWVMTALAVVALAVAWLLLPDSKIRDRNKIDYLGAVLLAIGLTAVIISIVVGSSLGLVSVIFLIGGFAFVAIFVVVEFRVKYPLLNLRITFRRTAWPAYVIGGLCGALAIYSNLAVISYIEVPPVLGYGFGSTPLIAAYFLCPIALFAIFGGVIVAPVMNRIGTRNTLIVGGVITAADFFWMTAAHYEVWQYIVGMALWGIGFSYAYTGANAAYLHAAKDGEAAMFSATNVSLTAAISGFGASVFTIVLTHQFIPKTQVPAPGQFGWLWFFAGCGGVVIILLALIYRKPAVEEAGHLTPGAGATPDAEDAGVPATK
jgi:MFS family permease